jgi:DNA invertase Pin-like site-specific DNA recombinase
VGELVGYARVSTSGQDLALQLDALQQAGCAAPRIYRDVGSGSIVDRPELARCLDYLREGDTLVVWRLDRLGRSLKHLIATIADLEARNVAFRSLQENVDTTTAAGRLQLHLFAALAEFERELGRERTRAGLQAARARGRVGGRPTVITARKLRAALAMRETDEMTMSEIAAELGVGEATLYRHLARHRDQAVKQAMQQAA